MTSGAGQNFKYRQHGGPLSIASHSTLLARFLSAWQRLSSPIQLTNEVAIRVVWAPSGHLRDDACAVMVGITPGHH
jgi:hypothetical protein